MGVTIDVHIGVTVNLGNYQSYKVEIGLNGVDPSEPIPPQLTQTRKPLEQVMAWVEERIGAELAANQIIPALKTRVVT